MMATDGIDKALCVVQSVHFRVYSMTRMDNGMK